MSTQATDSRTVRVVIIEDYRLVRLGLCAVLDKAPRIQVVGEAETGETGLEEVQRLKPDVVLVDIGLPGMTGIEVTQRIKAMNPSPKVIILTSHDREQDVIASLAGGANAYCLKDIPSNRLIEVVQSVADGAAWIDPAISAIALRIFSQTVMPQADAGALSAPDAMATAASPPKSSVSLSEREMEVLQLLVEGKSNQEIAETLFMSFHTAKAHVCNILQKLSVNDRGVPPVAGTAAMRPLA